MNRAVFLDRDGTIIKHVHYLKEPEGVELVPDGVESLQRLRDRGYLLVIVTNQSIIGRHTGTVPQVEAVNARINALYHERGIDFDLVLYCPHAPEDECDCRKPRPGLLYQAAAKLGIDLHDSVMVGDSPSDTATGQAVGCKLNVLIGEHEYEDEGVTKVGNLAEAVDLILLSD